MQKRICPNYRISLYMLAITISALAIYNNFWKTTRERAQNIVIIDIIDTGIIDTGIMISFS